MTAKEYLQGKHEWHKKHWNEHDYIDDNWWANEMEEYHQAKLKLLDIPVVMQAQPEKVCDKCLGKGGHHIYDSYLECKVCNGSGTTNL